MDRAHRWLTRAGLFLPCVGATAGVYAAPGRQALVCLASRGGRMAHGERYEQLGAPCAATGEGTNIRPPAAALASSTLSAEGEPARACYFFLTSKKELS
jgi:hypothetical protein